jgi:2,3-bisphosphoglycerate-dependent phosphoglycerate mutase
MFRVVISRHGESIWNQDSKFTGWTNIPLTDKGRLEAKQMATVMKPYRPSIIFTSVLQRSIETSTIIQKELRMELKKELKNEMKQKDYLNIPIHTSWRLNEKHYGTLEGIPRKYIRDVYGELFTQMMRSNFTMKPPILKNMDNVSLYPVYRNCYLESIKHGESKENVLTRLLPYYENDILYTLSEGHTPLILTHKHTARVLMKHLLQMTDEVFENYELPNKILVVNLNSDLKYVSHEELDYKK